MSIADEAAVSIGDLPEEFRRAAGRFCSGVTAVTLCGPAGHYGITATSFVSLSLRPLLVSVSINNSSAFLDEVGAVSCFAVNVLRHDQQHVSRYFASHGRGFSLGGFPGIASRVAATGAPVIDGALAWFDAEVEAILPAGDHQTLVGAVVAAGSCDGDPLVYWSGGYRRLDPTDPGTPDTRIAPLSEALSEQLHASGLSPAELIDAQLALEPAAAELAAFRRDPAALTALREALDRAEAAVSDPAAFTAEAVAFHAALGLASGNPAISATLNTLARSRHIHYAAGTSSAATNRTRAAHREIFEAIAAGKADTAREAMTRHLSVIRRGLQSPAPA